MSPQVSLTGIDHIIIAVQDLDQATDDYTQVLGFAPSWRGTHKNYGTKNALFCFENTYLELLAPEADAPASLRLREHIAQHQEGLYGIALGCNDLDQARNALKQQQIDCPEIAQGQGIDATSGAMRTWKNLFLPMAATGGALIFFIEHLTGELRSTDKLPNHVHRLDHLVVQTGQPERLIATYRDTWNIRLSLDQYIEKWGGRMLFFRLNKTTIEVISGPEQSANTKDSFWGLAWNVKDIRATRNRLVQAGVQVSQVRNGRKPDTLVCTVRSHTHNVPTLFIEHT
ncbi:MAG: VOC family protein [Gammaproteobacteria bacterium]